MVESKGMKLLNNKDEKYVKKNTIVKCSCGRENTMRLYDIMRNRKCMGCKQERTKKTCLKKYGVDNVSKSQEILDKIVKVNTKRYGTSYPMKNKEILEKSKKTCLEKYGKEYSFTQDWVYEKIRKIHMKNHGVEFPLQSKKIQEKIDITFIERYDSVRPNIYNLSNKVYTFPSGNSVSVMGYENIAIDYLITKKNIYFNKILNEENIFAGKKVPTFNYEDEKGKIHTYHPDIMLKCDNKILIVEVKCIYTFNYNSLINYLKFCSVVKTHDLGVMMYSDKKMLIDIWAFRMGKKPYSLMDTNMIISESPIIN